MRTFYIDPRKNLVTDFPSFQFTRDSASTSIDGQFLEQSIFEIESNAGDYVIGPGTARLQFDIFSYNYFNTNSLGSNYGHVFAIIRHNTSSVLKNKVLNGQGVVIGNVSNFKNPSKASKGNSVTPSVQAKTWANVLDDNCITNTSYNAPLQDNVQYRVVFDSIVTPTLKNKVRYRLFKVVGKDILELLYDTKQITVGSFDFDPTQLGISFGHVNGNLKGDIWRLEFTNIKTIWGPYLADDILPVDPCTCPRLTTVYSSAAELFEFSNSDFLVGLDYGVIETTSSGTPIYGFTNAATLTKKGYRLHEINSPFLKIPTFLNLGIKFRLPEDVLSREVRPNIVEYNAYTSWSVGVKGTVEIFHDCIEFAEYGKVYPIDELITDRFLNLGKTFPPKVLGNTLATATFIPFKFNSVKVENQRTNRKNIYFVYKLSEVTYYLNSSTGNQSRFVVANNVELTVDIPVDIGQETCCGDDINNLPAPLPSAIIPVPYGKIFTFYLNYNTGAKRVTSFIGGNGKVTATISPPLPKGLEFDQTTFDITGTPQVVYPPTTHTIVFKDSMNESETIEVIINVNSGSPS